jgi:hypothetical protein
MTVLCLRSLMYSLTLLDVIINLLPYEKLRFKASQGLS